MENIVIAFDLGASSGRAIVGGFKNNNLFFEEIHRFDNGPIVIDNHLYWDIDMLLKNIVIGINKATARYQHISSIGIDTWGVDFGLLDENGRLLSLPLHYRDSITDGILELYQQEHSLEDLFKCTGIQPAQINSFFQLRALSKSNPSILQRADSFLLIPDLLNYFLTGIKKTERTIASTTQLTNAYTKDWQTNLLSNSSLGSHAFSEIVESGNFLGMTHHDALLEQVAVINVCAHDTASAIVSVPGDTSFLYASCGTWSLIGTELAKPDLSQKALNAQLNNECGYSRTTRLLKNCTGLWLIQELRKEFAAQGQTFTYDEITESANRSEAGRRLIDTDHPSLFKPGSLRQKIDRILEANNQAPADSPGDYFRCIYDSLAQTYKAVINDIENATAQQYAELYLVGGGSQSGLLCQTIADTIQRPVIAGPTEASALGNLAVQFITHGWLSDITEFRRLIKQSGLVTQYLPATKPT